MTDKFIAEAITRTQNAADTERFEITFADANQLTHSQYHGGDCLLLVEHSRGLRCDFAV